MKKIVFIGLLISLSLTCFAGVIVKKSGERIDDISIKSVTDADVTYTSEKGESITIQKAELSAILYDDGRYEEIHMNNVSSTDYSESSPSIITTDNTWNTDWNNFLVNNKEEVKIVSKAVNIIVRKQGIFNFKGARNIDTQAMDAYYEAKSNGLSGEDAVRARNAVYINRANELTEGKKDALQTETYSSASANTFNIIAYGTFKSAKEYVLNHEYDGALVEYRVVIKEGNQTINTEFEEVGVVPFARVSESFKEAYIATYAKFNIDLPEEVSYMQTTPLVVEGLDEHNQKKVTIEYRLSKEGYKTITLVMPEMKTPHGKAVYIPLNKLTPLKGKEKDNISQSTVSTPSDPYAEYHDGQIYKLKKDAYYYVDSIYDTEGIKNVLSNCPEAMAKYKNGRTLAIAGWSTMPVFLAFTITGGCLLGVGDIRLHEIDKRQRNDYDFYSRVNYEAQRAEVYPLLDAGIAFLCMGPIGLAGVSVPLVCIGYHRMNNAYKVFNDNLKNNDVPMVISLKPSTNGIGLALTF